MHTVCDSALSGQTLLPFWPFFNKSDHPGLQSCNWPQYSPGPTSVSMVTRGHPLSPPGGVQRADEFGCCAQSKDQPTQTSDHPTITTADSYIQHLYIHSQHPQISHFKTIFSFSSTPFSDQRCSSMDKSNILVHHLLMCSAQANIDQFNWPLLDTSPHLISPTIVCAVANQWASEMPAYHVPLIIEYLQNLCSSNDQLTSF